MSLYGDLRLSETMVSRGWELVERIKGHDHITLWRATEKVRLPPDAPRLEIFVNKNRFEAHGGMYRWDIRYGKMFMAYGFAAEMEDLPVAYKLLGKQHRLYSNLE